MLRWRPFQRQIAVSQRSGDTAALGPIGCACYSSRASSPPTWSFSVELSLPHLPGRTPFRFSAHAPCEREAADAVHTSTKVTDECSSTGPGMCAVSNEDLIACLLRPSSKSSSPEERLMQERWVQFTRLCDLLVKCARCAPGCTLSGVIVTCKEVYWSARHLETAAAGTAVTGPLPSSTASIPTENISTTQAAVSLFQNHWKVPVTLVLNTTVPNRDIGVLSTSAARSAGFAEQRTRAECDVMRPAATPGGIDAVVTDFIARGGNRLLLVRGDTLPDPRRSLWGDISCGPLPGILDATKPPVDPPPQQAHRVLRTGADLVRHVSALRDRHLRETTAGHSRTGATALKLCVAGYPQGHPLDRTWGTTSYPFPASVEAVATVAAKEDRDGDAAARQRSLAFLRAFEEDFDAADRGFGAAVCIAKRRVCYKSLKKSSNEPSADDCALFEAVEEGQDSSQHSCSPHFDMPELKELCRTIGRLNVVRRLWTSSSSYEPDVRAACVHQMLRDKVLQRSPAEHTCEIDARRSFHTDMETPVIVTQMIASGKELTDYVAEVNNELQAWGTAGTGGKDTELSTEAHSPDGQRQQQRQPSAATRTMNPTSISVIPGVLLPHPTNVHILLRSLYYTKVIPSARMQEALEAYASELTNAWQQLAREHPLKRNPSVLKDDTLLPAPTVNNVSSEKLEIREGCVGQVEAHVARVQRDAASRLTSAWLSQTVDLLHEIHQHGHTQVHLFTMFNDRVDERIAQLLTAYDAQRGAS